MLHDGKPQARAVVTTVEATFVRPAIETPENPVLVVRGDAGTVVHHAQRSISPGGVGPHRHRDVGAVGRELDGVLHQLGQGRGQLRRITVHICGHIVMIHFERDLGFGQTVGFACRDLIDYGIEAQAVARRRLYAFLRLEQQHEVGDEMAQIMRLVFEGRGVRADFVDRRLGIVELRRQFFYLVHRFPELHGHVRHKIVADLGETALFALILDKHKRQLGVEWRDDTRQPVGARGGFEVAHDAGGSRVGDIPRISIEGLCGDEVLGGLRHDIETLHLSGFAGRDDQLAQTFIGDGVVAHQPQTVDGGRGAHDIVGIIDDDAFAIQRCQQPRGFGRQIPVFLVVGLGLRPCLGIQHSEAYGGGETHRQCNQ